jgi:hypothetical protein
VFGVVHVDEIDAFLQGHADTLAPQDQLDAHPVGVGVQPLLALPHGADQSLFLIEPDGPGGYPEFLCQL